MINNKQTTQLSPISINKVTATLLTCQINISRYSLDNLKTFHPEGYTMLYRPRQASDGLNYFTKVSKIVLDSEQQSKLQLREVCT